MKLVCEVIISGSATLKVLTTANSQNQGLLVKAVPGVGKPFLMFDTLPAGTLVLADFEGAPVVSADVAANNAAIDAMKADPPLDRLTFAP